MEMEIRLVIPGAVEADGLHCQLHSQVEELVGPVDGSRPDCCGGSQKEEQRHHHGPLVP